MGVKRGNLELISGLLLPSFILNYMLIRVKESGLNKKRKEQKEREKRTIKRKKRTKLWEIACLIKFFSRGRLWFLYYS